MIIPQAQALQVAEVGGKAVALARLAGFGFAPPAFFVIRAEAFEGEVCAGLEAALQGLGPGPYAVRSSARAEDGALHSHAGQFETVLNVAAADVWAAARRVWASGFAGPVATYRAVRSGGAAEGPAVIVQRMVAARAAGVAFSADPVTGQRDHVILSAIAGLGDRLVSGEADGEDWTVGAVVNGPARPLVLTLAEAHAVADLARRAEAAFGMPQDIEWALDERGLHILQSRPITTPLLAVPRPDLRLTIFDNSNIVESYPGVVSPLTYSFAVHVYARVYRAFVGMLGVRTEVVEAHAAVFANMLGRVDGRVYYNLVNWYRALALLPGFALNRGYMETMMGVATPMPAEVTGAIGPAPVTGLARVAEYGRVARVAFGLVWQALKLPRTRARFYARLNAALDSGFDVHIAGPTELAAEYRRIESNLLDRWDAPLVNDFLCMIAFGASRSLMQRWLGPAGLEVHNGMMIGQGDIISAEPAQRIAQMGRMVAEAGLVGPLTLEALAPYPGIAAAVASYLSKFGDRCTEELKLESIDLSEDPSSLLQAIAASALRPATPEARADEPDWAALFPNPVKRVVARSLLGWTKARVRDRENLRFERTRIFGHTRRVFLALGREFAARGLLAAPRDVFYLTVGEVLAAVEGAGLSPNLKALAAQRKAEDAASERHPDPPERIEVRGPAIAPGWTATLPITDQARARTGTGCSAGLARGRARIIRDPRSEALAPGDILVARHTDPGWIAVFCNAGAIVVERGSLLSHSAIVARELGIPCVVGLKGATDWIRDGEMIAVDGAMGLVERCDATL